MPRKKKRNTIIEKLLIENYAAEGKSLARWEGKVVFVERTVPGDVVDVFLFKNKKDWAEGYPLVFHELSPKRATPFCRHYGDCGGCQWQSVPYAEQLSFKFQQVKDALQRIGKLPLPEFMPILGCEEDRHYRNKLEYTFGTYRYVPDGEYVKKEPGERKKAEPEKTGAAGFHAKGLFDKIVDISECHLQPEPSNKVREAVRQFALENDLSYYDVRHHSGFLRNIQLRICATGEVMVNVIVGEDDFAKTEPLLQYLMQQVPEITTLL